MKKYQLWKIINLPLIIIILFFEGSNLQGAEEAKYLPDFVSPYSISNKNLPVFELPALQSESEKNYLGLTENRNFYIGQIKAKVLIIEFFSFYCPHCQKAASKVNDLYQKIQNQTATKEKIKIIGIGVGNSEYEVNSFRNKYQIDFPLFPDKNMDIVSLLHVRSTPSFIGIKFNENKTLEQFYLREGGFDDAQQFLSEIVKLSGIESGDKNGKTKK